MPPDELIVRMFEFEGPDMVNIEFPRFENLGEPQTQAIPADTEGVVSRDRVWKNGYRRMRPVRRLPVRAATIATPTAATTT
ncbi:hypothetical protein BH09ACT8_BH09ACT8_01960 [soil metagenome]